MMGMMRTVGSGYVRPEQGPDMMWNTRYGMHGMMTKGNVLGTTPIIEDHAGEIAQRYLDAYFHGSNVEDLHTFYGYYSIHVAKDEKVTGMLSVNAYSGQVWYHNWHGHHIQTLELHG